LPQERRSGRHWRIFEHLAINQAESPFFKTASAWVIISNSGI